MNTTNVCPYFCVIRHADRIFHAPYFIGTCGLPACTIFFYIRPISYRRDEVTWEWRTLHNEELNDLYSSPKIVRVIKSRKMSWAGNVARMGEERGCV